MTKEIAVYGSIAPSSFDCEWAFRLATIPQAEYGEREIAQRERLMEEVARLEAFLQPTDHKIVGECIDTVIDCLDIRHPFRAPAVRQIYLKLIGEYPEAIVRESSRLLLTRHKWRTMPTIADWTTICHELMAPIRTYMAHLRIALMKIAAAERALKRS